MSLLQKRPLSAIVLLIAVISIIDLGLCDVQAASAQLYPLTSLKRVTGSDTVSADCFGESVAVDGDTMVVGASCYSSGSGAAYIFYRNQSGSNQWGQVKKLVLSGAASGDRFGASVAISGDVIVVGAWNRGVSGANSGAISIYGRNVTGTDAWGLIKTITATSFSAGNAFGSSVAIQGDCAMMGSLGRWWHADLDREAEGRLPGGRPAAMSSSS